MTQRHARTASKLAALGVASALGMGALVGCAMPNSSNPTLSITEARVMSGSAELDMTLMNPSDMNVVVETIDWSLVFGPLPVAEGDWTLGVAVPSKGEHRFSQRVRFTSPAMDPSADEVELSGTIHMTTEGNAGDTALKEASFVATRRTER